MHTDLEQVARNSAFTQQANHLRDLFIRVYLCPSVANRSHLPDLG